jgi:molybdate transport system substrate-binding protein
MATRHILTDLVRDYEASHGTRVEIRSMGGVEAARLVRAGEAADIVILASKVMASLEAEGHLVRGDTKDFARSEIGLAVRAGLNPPSVADEQAVKQAMGDARKICYSTGPSGDHLKALCEKWAIPLARTLVAPPGVPVATLIANGEADLGFQQLSELIGQSGIEVVGPLPREIQAVTVFSAGISINSREPEPARALVRRSRRRQTPSRHAARIKALGRPLRPAQRTRLGILGETRSVSHPTTCPLNSFLLIGVPERT